MGKVVLTPQIELEAWASPAEGFSLDDLAEQFRQRGTPILEIDRTNNRIKILHVTRKEI